MGRSKQTVALAMRAGRLAMLQRRGFAKSSQQNKIPPVPGKPPRNDPAPSDASSSPLGTAPGSGNSAKAAKHRVTGVLPNATTSPRGPVPPRGTRLPPGPATAVAPDANVGRVSATDPSTKVVAPGTVGPPGAASSTNSTAASGNTGISPDSSGSGAVATSGLGPNSSSSSGTRASGVSPNVISGSRAVVHPRDARLSPGPASAAAPGAHAGRVSATDPSTSVAAPGAIASPGAVSNSGPRTGPGAARDAAATGGINSSSGPGTTTTTSSSSNSSKPPGPIIPPGPALGIGGRGSSAGSSGPGASAGSGSSGGAASSPPPGSNRWRLHPLLPVDVRLLAAGLLAAAAAFLYGNSNSESPSTRNGSLGESSGSNGPSASGSNGQSASGGFDRNENDSSTEPTAAIIRAQHDSAPGVADDDATSPGSGDGDGDGDGSGGNNSRSTPGWATDEAPSADSNEARLWASKQAALRPPSNTASLIGDNGTGPASLASSADGHDGSGSSKFGGGIDNSSSSSQSSADDENSSREHSTPYNASSSAHDLTADDHAALDHSTKRQQGGRGSSGGEGSEGQQALDISPLTDLFNSALTPASRRTSEKTDEAADSEGQPVAPGGLQDGKGGNDSAGSSNEEAADEPMTPDADDLVERQLEVGGLEMPYIADSDILPERGAEDTAHTAGTAAGGSNDDSHNIEPDTSGKSTDPSHPSNPSNSDGINGSENHSHDQSEQVARQPSPGNAAGESDDGRGQLKSDGNEPGRTRGVLGIPDDLTARELVAIAMERDEDVPDQAWVHYQARRRQALSDARTFEAALQAAQHYHQREVKRREDVIESAARYVRHLQHQLEQQADEKVRDERLLRQRAQQHLSQELRRQGRQIEEAAELAANQERVERNRELDSLRIRLGALGRAFSARSDEAQSSHTAHKVTLAVIALQTALQQGTPFQGQLESLALGGQEDPLIRAALAALPQQLADSGLPTSEQLAARFADVSRSVAELSYIPGKSVGLLSLATSRLAASLKVREIDTYDSPVVASEGVVSHGPTESLAAAAGALSRGDIQSAATLLEQSAAGSAAEAVAAEWVAAARARASADQTLSLLQAHATAMTSALT